VLAWRITHVHLISNAMGRTKSLSPLGFVVNVTVL
jgi:hypothetical protein